MSDSSISPKGQDADTFERPELKYEEPKLSVLGDLAEVTKGFFGSFSP